MKKPLMGFYQTSQTTVTPIGALSAFGHIWLKSGPVFICLALRFGATHSPTSYLPSNVHCMVAVYYIEFHFKLPTVEFLGRNMTPSAAAGEARRRLRQCAVVREWF